MKSISNNLNEKKNPIIGSISLTSERVTFLAGLYERTGRTVQAEDLWIHAVDIGLSTSKDLGEENVSGNDKSFCVQKLGIREERRRTKKS